MATTCISEQQLYNADGSAVNPKLYASMDYDYSISGSTVTFTLNAHLRIASASSWYNNRIQANIGFNGSHSDGDIKPATSGAIAQNTVWTRSATFSVDLSSAPNPISVSLDIRDDQSASAGSPWSVGTFTGSIPLPIVVPTITGLTFTNIGTNSATASFTVSNNGGQNPTGYRFWISTDSSVPDSSATTKVEPASASYTFTGLSPYTTYYVKAWAKNSAGWSSVLTGSFKTVGNPPTLSETSKNGATYKSLSVSFSVTNAWGLAVTAYKIELSTNSAMTGIIQTSSSTSATFDNLDPNTTYWVRCSASNVVGTSYNTTVSYATTAFTSPSVPLSLALAVVGGGDPIPTAAYKGSWAAPSTKGSAGLSGYEFQWLKKTKSGSYAQYGDTITVSSSGTSKQITLDRTNFKPTDSISFRIRAYSTYKKNYYSNWATATGIEIVIEKFVSVSKNGGSFNKYRIYVSKNGGAFTELEKDQTFKLL